MADTTVLYDIAPCRSQIRAFHAELRKAEEVGHLAISRIFEILPVRVVTPDGRQILQSRGDGYLRKSGGVYVNTSTNTQQIEFLDDALGKVVLFVPATVQLAISAAANYITLTSVGSSFEVTIPSLPREMMTPPVSFLSFVVGDDFMQTHIRDKLGATILIDGRSAENSDEFFITKDMLLLLASYEDIAECILGDGKNDDKKDDKKEERKKQDKYRILRDNNNGVCTVDFTGGEIGGRTEMGGYGSYEEAAAAMAAMYADGRCGPPPDNH
jgi:hypothetical protein